MTEPATIATRDGSMYVSRIGVDRRLDSNSQPQASATVMKRNGDTYGRVTMTEEDFSTLAETGTPEEKEFASRSIEALHNYESSGLMASREPLAFSRPDTLPTAAPQEKLALAPPSPSP